MSNGKLMGMQKTHPRYVRSWALDLITKNDYATSAHSLERRHQPKSAVIEFA